MGAVLIFHNITPPEGVNCFNAKTSDVIVYLWFLGVHCASSLLCDVCLPLCCHLLFIFWLLCEVEELSIDTRNYVRRSDVHRVY